jgi:hypothetical protein
VTAGASMSAAGLAALETRLRKFAPPGLGTAPPIPVSGIQTEFCAIWPKDEPILKLVAKYIVFIPGVGPTAAGVITGLVTAGDAISKVVRA